MKSNMKQKVTNEQTSKNLTDANDGMVVNKGESG